MSWYRKSSAGIRLWVDDDRDPKDPDIQKLFWTIGDEVWAKTEQEAIAYLKTENVDSISLDNDLGPKELNGEGYGVANWIEEHAHSGELKRLRWTIHTQNPVKATAMFQALTNADRFWHEQETGKRGVAN